MGIDWTVAKVYFMANRRHTEKEMHPKIERIVKMNIDFLLYFFFFFFF